MMETFIRYPEHLGSTGKKVLEYWVLALQELTVQLES